MGWILLEQGVVGLILWLAFICWCAGRRPRDQRDPWLFGKQLAWFFCMVSFVIAMTGTGLMTSIPNSMLLFMGLGYCVSPYVVPAKSDPCRFPAVRARLATRTQYPPSGSGFHDDRHCVRFEELKVFPKIKAGRPVGR